MGVAERLLAYDSLCGATTRVTECLPAYYRRFRMSTGLYSRFLDFYCHCRARTGVAKRVLAFDSLCGTRTGVRECLLAFNSLWTGLVIVTSNVYSVVV